MRNCDSVYSGDRRPINPFSKLQSPQSTWYLREHQYNNACMLISSQEAEIVILAVVARSLKINYWLTLSLLLTWQVHLQLCLHPGYHELRMLQMQ